MSITINVTAANDGSFTASGVDAPSVNLTVGGGIGPPGAGNVALAAGDGITISSTANVATITSTVQGVPASNLADLADVDATAPTSGQVLEWNGTAWAPGLDSTLTLSSTGGSDLGASNVGVSSEAARADHVHNLPTFAEITNGTASVTGNLTLNASTGGVIVNGGTSAGSLTLNCEQNTHGITIASPAHAAGASYTLTLPATAGSANQVLTTDGTGSLSWSNGTSSGSGGGISWTTPAPGNSSDAGTAGAVAYSGQFFFLHNGTQWNRVQLSGFGTLAANNLLTEGGDTLATEAGNQIAYDGLGSYPGGGGGGTASNWSQLGADIDGASGDDYFGRAVAISDNGTRVAAGAPTSGLSTAFGYVRVYDWSGTAWTQVGSDIAGEEANDGSGDAVAISSNGNRIAVGAVSNSGTGTVPGHVRVYDWSGTAWTQVGLDIDGSTGAESFGSSVDLSSDGSRLAVSAPANDSTLQDAGHVRVYDWSGTAWTQVGSDIAGERAGDFSGSVSLSGNGSRLAIGTGGNDDAGASAGHVRVYDWSGTAWTQVGSDIDGAAAYEQFGKAVALSSDGTRLAVGGDYDRGRVRVYDWSGTAWTQIGSDIDGAAAGDRFGYTVSIASDGSRVAVGAFDNDDAGASAGHVRVYDWNGTAWTQVGSDIDGAAAGDRFGYTVALSGDGSAVVSGGYLNDGAATAAGHIRIFEYT